MYQTVTNIVRLNKKIAGFWSVAHGWACPEAAIMLEKSRLDLQVALSESLGLWIDGDGHPGNLRLAWANVGALVEGSLKWFLAVHYQAYLNDPDSPRNKNGVIPADGLQLEQLRQFFQRRISHIYDDHREFIEMAQYRRNGIHSFKHREIGSQEELEAGIDEYWNLLAELDDLVPYP